MAKKRKKLKKKKTTQPTATVSDMSAMKEKSDKSIQDFDTLMSEINAGLPISDHKPVEKDKQAETKKEEPKTTVSDEELQTVVFTPDETKVDNTDIPQLEEVAKMFDTATFPLLPTIVCFPDGTEVDADNVEECKTKELELKKQAEAVQAAADSEELKELVDVPEKVTEIESNKVVDNTPAETDEHEEAVNETAEPTDSVENENKNKSDEAKETELTNPTVVFYPTNCEKMNLNPSTENGAMENTLKFDDISEQDDYQIHEKQDKQLDKDLSENNKEDIIDETGDELTELQETDSDDDTGDEKDTKIENDNCDKFDLFYQDQRHQYLVDTNITILVVLSILAVLSFIGWI